MADTRSRASRRGAAAALLILPLAGCTTGSQLTRSSAAVVQDIPSSQPSDVAQFGGSGQLGQDKAFSAALTRTGSATARLAVTVLSDRRAGDELTSISSPQASSVTFHPRPLRLSYEHPVRLGTGGRTVTVNGLRASLSSSALVTIVLHFAHNGALRLSVPLGGGTGAG